MPDLAGNIRMRWNTAFYRMQLETGKAGENKSSPSSVVDEARLPEELLKLVTEKKEASFKMTYADSGYLYLCVGYGKQDSGGYSITVDDLYASGEMIYLDTSLIGPKQAKELAETPPIHIL